MNKMEIDKLCRAWVVLYKEGRNPLSDKESPHFWAFEKLDDVMRDSPTLAWEIILRILAIDSSNSTIANISAGPIENILVLHGPAMIGIIEEESLKNDALRFSLVGVWKNAMSDEVWDRLQRIARTKITSVRMGKAKIDALCRAWVDFYAEHREDILSETVLKSPHYWAVEKLNELIRNNPELAWRTILRILSINSNDVIVEKITRGPLEDLLVFHGHMLMDSVEQEIVKNDTLKSVLKNVWRGCMHENTWKHLQKII